MDKSTSETIAVDRRAGDNSFGDLLRHYREAAGLTRDELAERAGISAKAIGALERGDRRRPHPYTVRQLFVALALPERERGILLTALSPRPARPVAVAPLPSTMPASRRLPVPPTRLIGREQDLAAIGEFIRGSARLVTLTGVGGCGKTRLALMIAAELESTFLDGVRLVELAALDDPELVSTAIARTLGVVEAPGQPLIETIWSVLGSRHLLLVVDNCEHLIDACAIDLAKLLAACPNLSILATSREALRIPGERRYRVQPLALPVEQTQSSERAIEELRTSPAVELFVERAKAVETNFELSPANAATVAGICAKLAGIPLALELAAARTQTLTLGQILTLLNHSLRLLVGTQRATPSRQQTLRACLDWSHTLLTPPEQATMRRLSVFAGGWELDAAEAVVSGEDISPLSVLDLLTRLVDKSLVVADLSGPTARYRFLEPVRQYAAARLETSSELPATRARQLAYFLCLAEQAAPRLRGAEQSQWLTRLEQEHGNLRGALDWAEERGDTAAALRLGAALWRFWHMRNDVREGRDRLRNLLGLPVPATATATRRICLFGAGILAIQQTDYEAADHYFRELLSSARTAKDEEYVASALHQLGRIAFWKDQHIEAEKLTREALTIRRAAGQRRLVALSLGGLADVVAARGDYVTARGYYEECLTLLRQESDWDQAVHLLCNLGDVALAQGDLVAAQACVDESIALCRTNGLERDIAYVLVLLGGLARVRGDCQSAMAAFGNSLHRARRTGTKRMIASGLEAIGAVLADQQRPSAATRLFGAAAALRQRTRSRLLLPKRAIREQAIATIRLTLSDDAFATAWVNGENLTLDQAVDEALAVTNAALRNALPAFDSDADLSIGEMRPVSELLTQREIEVAGLLAGGYSDREIAARLSISAATVGTHVHHILQKLALRSRFQVAARLAATSRNESNTGGLGHDLSVVTRRPRTSPLLEPTVSN